MDTISGRFPLSGSSAVVATPTITIGEIADLIGKADQQNPLTTQQESRLKTLCKGYLDVGDGQDTQPESEKRTNELLDLALTFWLNDNSYVAAEIMQAVYPYARVCYGHVETEKNYYINSQDKGAFFESITIRADRGCKVAQYAVGKELFENKDYAQATEYLQKSTEQGYSSADEVLKKIPAASQMPLAESASSPIKPIPFREKREELEKSLSNNLEKDDRSKTNFQLGMLWYGQSSHPNFANARRECERYLTLAAKEGDKDAAYQLCVLYEANFFDSKNHSAFYRQRALELGHPVAVLENDAKDNPEKLFELYEFYCGKEYAGIRAPNANKADHYLLSAANLGHPVALNIVIDLINENKLTLPSDKLERYRELFCQAATTEESSVYECAVINKKAGREALAVKLFQQAAKEGKEDNGEAMIELGQFCDAIHDADGAIRHYLLEQATKGNVHAMIGLGDSFRKSKNSQEAMKYYNMALLGKSDEATKTLIHMNIGRLYDDQYQNTRFFGKSDLRNNAIAHYELSKRDEVNMAVLLLKAERGDPDARFEAAVFLSSTAPFNQGPAYKDKIENYLLSALATKDYFVEASAILFQLHEKHFFPGDSYSDSDKWAKFYLQKITEAANSEDTDAIRALVQLSVTEPPHRLLPQEIRDQYKPQGNSPIAS